MAKKTPLLKDNKLYIWDEYETRYTINGRDDITDSQVWPYWMEFLEREKSLRVEYTEKSGDKLKYSVYKVKHPEEGHGWFWVAHKQVNGRRYRKYIGKNANMTGQKLYAVAREICQTRIAV